MSTKSIFVKTHVSRDLLQNAALFQTDKLVAWEYVSNGLQYVDAGTNPIVYVRLDSKAHKIRITDNGRGMDLEGLQNFFVMHGENLDRKAGLPGRGRFGTGKSAAFGVGDLLRVTSVRNGHRAAVELSRADLEKASSGDPIPVRILESDIITREPNGTRIDVEGIHLRSLDQAGIIRYIERHLARWPKNCSVFVNNHECEYVEPAIAEVRRFQPTGPLQETLGDIALVIKIAKAPVDPDLRGISIFANGVWHENTLAGSEDKEMANYILGEIDVPRLDSDKSPIPPFDLSRSMRLNPNNQLVQHTHAFIGQCVEQVRKGLVERERQRRASDEARRLAQQAADIARFLNDDFNAFRDKIKKVRARATGLIDVHDIPEQGPDDVAIELGGDIPSRESQTGATGAVGPCATGGNEPRHLMPELEPDDNSAPVGQRIPRSNRQASSRGGFRVEFKAMGVEEYRAVYVPAERTIYINLDHPQLLAAQENGNREDPTFRRLAYEVAFTEYAIAITSELGNRGEYSDWSDPIYDVRETVNRLARKGSHLYTA